MLPQVIWCAIMSKNAFIPVCEPCFLGNEEKYVADAVKSGWISSAGSYLNEFEKRFAAYCGVKHGVTCSNGTTALHLALLALGIEENDEVIIPNFTMVAVLNAVLCCRAQPVFVDAQSDTWNIDPNLIEKKITSRTKAIIAVHTYGHPVDMDPIVTLAAKHKLAIVEDAAEAHAAEYRGKKCGGLGHIACFSFFGNKIVTTGEGGMVVTNDEALAERCRYFKNLCFPMKGPRDYVHDDLGYNYRMTNMQAALGVAQLEHIDELAERRRRNAKFYNGRLGSVPGLQLPVEKDYAKNVYWMYGIVVDKARFGLSRDELMARLKDDGVDTRYFFRPMHSQKVLGKFGIQDSGAYPVSQHLSESGLYLPSGSGLTESQLERVCRAIIKAHSDGTA